MKKIIILIFAFLVCSLKIFAQETPVKDIQWDGEKGKLSYTLSNNFLIKIRAGSADGPVYKTLVNLEKREKGAHLEAWNGKDTTGKIIFEKFGKLHFCIDPNPKPYQDIDLKYAQRDSVLVIDTDEKERNIFEKEGFEIRIFLDNNLIKVAQEKKLPYLYTLEPKKIFDKDAEPHLVTINLWDRASYASLGSANILLSSQDFKKEAQQLKGKIVFSKYDGNFYQIWSMDLENKTVKKLTDTPFDKRYPDISPDGKIIVYVSNEGQPWIINENGERAEKIDLPVSCYEPKFSSDMKNILFTSYRDIYSGDTDIWQYSFANAKLTKLINRAWLQFNPNYSPDEKEIIFTDGPELYGQEIRKLNLKSEDITQLTDNGPYDYDAKAMYMPDGERIVYSSNESGDYEIWIMDKFGRNKMNLTQSPGSYDISPIPSKNYGKILFLSDRSGSLQIWMINQDGSEKQQITEFDDDILDFSIYTE